MMRSRAAAIFGASAACCLAGLACLTGLTAAGASPPHEPFARGGAYMGWSLRSQGPLAARGAARSTSRPQGLDVSSYQGDVDWTTVKADGAQFSYVKATEGTYYTNPYFTEQYNGSYGEGIIRGSYHFAIPNGGSGASQANYFLAHGGGWSADGMTLPGALDIEYNPYGAECYGLSQSAMVSWIKSFVYRYHRVSTRWPVIYSTADWWSTCTGNSTAFGKTSPLWLADYNGSPGTVPGNWATYTFWQFASSGTFPGDQDVFNGSYTRLQVLAKG